MPRMRIDYVYCAACQHYIEEGISHRCTLSSNLGKNWLGLVYHEHPEQKNYNGRCKDYEETDNGSTGRSTGSSVGTDDGVRDNS
jgi:hypothetical protein